MALKINLDCEKIMPDYGDQAFRKTDPKGRWFEMTYGGALSFLRRKYTKNLKGVDIAVSGIPFDAATKPQKKKTVTSGMNCAQLVEFFCVMVSLDFRSEN